MSLLKEKKQRIFNLSCCFKKKRQFKIRDLAHLIGDLVAVSPAVKYDPIYVEDLKRCKFLALKDKEGDFDATTQLPAYIHEGLDWWILNIKNPSLCNSIRNGRYSFEICSDASRIG